MDFEGSDIPSGAIGACGPMNFEGSDIPSGEVVCDEIVVVPALNAT